MENRLLVFDLDGTLHLTEKALTPAIQMAMADMGFTPASPGRINSLYGEPLEVFCTELLGTSAAEPFSEFRLGIRKHQKATVPATGELYPGTVEMLEELHSMGYSTAVCSNSGRHYIDLVLETLGIGEMIPMRRGIEGEASKTDRIAGLISAAGSDIALVAGDRHHDMTAAAENRIPGIWCGYGYGRENEGSGAPFTAEKTADITSIASCALVADAVERLLNRASESCPCIGISGWDSSGKTTFARFVCRYLRARGMKVQLISMDDFHNPLVTRREGPDEKKAYIDNAFDRDRLCRELLEPARNGEVVSRSLSVLDLETDRFDRTVDYDITPGTVLVLEGVLLGRDPVDRYLDAIVFLDVREDVILKRAMERDGPAVIGRYREKYIPIQKWFDSEFDTRERADLLVDNNRTDRPAIVREGSTRGS